jgi:hypothetical protein
VHCSFVDEEILEMSLVVTVRVGVMISNPIAICDISELNGEGESVVELVAFSSRGGVAARVRVGEVRDVGTRANPTNAIVSSSFSSIDHRLHALVEE